MIEDQGSSVVELFARRDDPCVRDELVRHYLPLARSLARRYAGSGQALEDLEQVAGLGLLKAIDGFDAGKGQFESYAVPTILGELRRHHRDRGWSVRVPRRLQENVLSIKAAMATLSQDLKASPTVNQIADHTGLSYGDVLEALDAQDAYSTTSLSSPVDDEGKTALSDRLEAPDDGIEIAEGWADLLPHLRRLPEREQRIIALRFFADRTQTEIATELGISQMHVSRLLSRSLEMMREALTGSEDAAREA